MHARLYDESRHVDKFQRDHRPRVLRQTKGAWLRTVIFCRIYGAPSFTALLQNSRRDASKPRVRTHCTYPRRGNASFVSHFDSSRWLSRNWRIVAREMARDLFASCGSTTRSDRFLGRIKPTSLTFTALCVTRGTRRFFQILLRILVAHCLTDVTIRDPRGWHKCGVAQCGFKFFYIIY